MKSICQLLFLLVLLNGNSFGQTNKINKKDKNGRKQGHWIYYGADRPETQFADTSKVEEGDYEDDRKTGVWIKYNKDGTIRATGEFQNNRPFDPKIQVDRPAQIVETSNCTFDTKSNLTPESKIEFTPPSVSNGHPYSYYIAPKYPTQSYFPMTYIGENIDYLFAGFLSFVYPSPEELQEIVNISIPILYLIGPLPKMSFQSLLHTTGIGYLSLPFSERTLWNTILLQQLSSTIFLRIHS